MSVEIVNAQPLLEKKRIRRTKIDLKQDEKILKKSTDDLIHFFLKSEAEMAEEYRLKKNIRSATDLLVSHGLLKSTAQQWLTYLIRKQKMDDGTELLKLNMNKSNEHFLSMALTIFKDDHLLSEAINNRLGAKFRTLRYTITKQIKDNEMSIKSEEV